MEKPQMRRGKVRSRIVERVRVICIRNTNYCVRDDKVPLAIYSNKADADSHRQRLLQQLSLIGAN
jgi:hypothetical protein